MGILPESVKIGTCSWKYDSWKDLVYSQDVGRNYLYEYARKYKLVEVDKWFWSLFGEKVVMRKPEVVAEYMASVPKDFSFSIKVPNTITLTHQYTRGKKRSLETNPHFLSNEMFENFVHLLLPMKGQVNSLIFQFEYLNKNKMPNQTVFQERLEAFFKKCPQGVRYCVETRNPNYLNKRYFSFLNTLNLTHVFLQGYWMPSIFDLYKRFQHFIKDFTLIRLHGPNRKKIEQKTRKQWNRVVDPKDEELCHLAQMVKDLCAKNISVTINVNNHYEGCAPMSIDRFLKMYFKG